MRIYERMKQIQSDFYARKTFKQIKKFEQILEKAIKDYSDLFLESFRIDLTKVEEVTFRGETHYRKAVLAKRLRTHIQHIEHKAPLKPISSKNMTLIEHILFSREYAEENPIGYLHNIWEKDYWEDFKEKLEFICRILGHNYYTHREKRFLLLTYHDFIRCETHRFYSFADFLKDILENLQKRISLKKEYGDQYCFVCDAFIDFRSKIQHKHDLTGYKIALIELEETVRGEA